MTPFTTQGLRDLAALLAGTCLAAASAQASLVTLSDPAGNFSASLDPSLGSWSHYGSDLPATHVLNTASISQGSLVFANFGGFDVFDYAPQHWGASAHSSLNFQVSFTPASGLAITGYDISYSGRYGAEDAYGGSPQTLTVNGTGLGSPTTFALSETADRSFSLTRRVLAGNTLNVTATLDVNTTGDHHANFDQPSYVCYYSWDMPPTCGYFGPSVAQTEGAAIDSAYMYGVIDTISIKPVLGTASVPIAMVPESDGWQLALAGLGLLSGALATRRQRTRA